MTALEKMRILQRDIESLSPSSCEPEEILFLVKSFNVMRKLFIRTLDEEHGPDCTKWADDMFEEEMKEEKKA